MQLRATQQVICPDESYQDVQELVLVFLGRIHLSVRLSGHMSVCIFARLTSVSCLPASCFLGLFLCDFRLGMYEFGLEIQSACPSRLLRHVCRCWIKGLGATR